MYQLVRVLYYCSLLFAVLLFHYSSRSISTPSGLLSNGHAPAKPRAKYMTAPRTGVGSISDPEQRTQNESVRYLDLQLPRNQPVHSSQVEEVSYAIIQR